LRELLGAFACVDTSIKSHSAWPRGIGTRLPFFELLLRSCFWRRAELFQLSSCFKSFLPKYLTKITGLFDGTPLPSRVTSSLSTCVLPLHNIAVPLSSPPSRIDFESVHARQGCTTVSRRQINKDRESLNTVTPRNTERIRKGPSSAEALSAAPAACRRPGEEASAHWPAANFIIFPLKLPT